MIQILDDMEHCRVKENLAVWSQGAWQYYNVDYMEPMPLSSQAVVNFGAATANATIGQTELTTVAVDTDELLQVRFFPIDDIEMILWLTRGQSKFTTRGATARVSKLTRAIDPYLRSSEFNVLGRDRNAFVEVRNLGDYNIAQARAWFFQKKYILKRLDCVVEQPDATGVLRAYVKLADGKLSLLPMTYIDAEART